MSFNIIESSKKIANKYQRYLATMFDINDTEYKEIFDKRLHENNIFEKGPYLEVTNSFAKGKSLKQLIEEGLISKDFEKIPRLYEIPNLHYHQEQALRKAINGENLIVSTGTGSGKTECFLLPIINELMREKEQGTLTDGVRAIIIYPMNALANDQIDRLRKTFINYPYISFGCYTGQTQEEQKDALAQYKSLNGKRLDDVRLQNPLKNEILSREEMKERPPHILITNYAMLEYLMLRPNDNVFFDGPLAHNWKFIVLDEAHTYTGSTGIEVSMLLRRLMAKLSNQKIQYILTSATLGNQDSNQKVIAFAKNLCSVDFKEENIIRAKRVTLEQKNKYTLDKDFYEIVEGLIDCGYDDSYIINEIETKYHFKINVNDLGEYLFEILINDNTFWKIKNYVLKPRNILEICEFTKFSEKEISSFVEVASRANKNNSKLFDARYHMFLRATEGVFITLAPHKDLFLTRKNSVTTDEGEYKVFEAVTCKQCHSLYLLGTIKNNKLIQKTTIDSNEIRDAFYIGESYNDTDEDTTLDKADLKAEKYYLCPHCGFIIPNNLNEKKTCGHSEKDFISVVKVQTKAETGRVTKCICCENVNRLGILRGFFSGQEASTSVIGTALFEELPNHIRKVTIHNNNDDNDDGFEIEPYESFEEITKAKQFIAFSDSRQAAAYFASYFSISYDGILYGRLIHEVLNSYKNDSIEMRTFVELLADKMQENKISPFEDFLYSLQNNSSTSIDYEKLGWKAILKGLAECTQINSLVGLGLLALDFNDKIKFSENTKYNLSEQEIKDICMVFVMGMLADVAFYYPKHMNDNDKEFFTFNGKEISYLLNDNAKYVNSFIPLKSNNKRFDYLNKILKKIAPNSSTEDVKNLLEKIWEHFFVPTNLKLQIMNKDIDNHYKVNLENLIITKNKKWYICNKCHKLTFLNVKGICPAYKCEGSLEEVDVDALEKENHYYRMYHDLKIQPLRIVEHTAQLDKKEAYSYQTLFKDQKIDVLSCSTTFELGVDVGDLETVFMRNMPPSPSNYAQRAGRAGRSSTSAAFALTFCNKSNHDFNYFAKPTEMICGTIFPPQFKIDNEKICIRHLYSSVFGFFFKEHPEYFSTAQNLMEKDENLPSSGYDELSCYLKNEKVLAKIRNYLLNALPKSLHGKFEISSNGWVNWLFSDKNEEYPSLKLVQDVYLNEINILEKELEIAKNENNGNLLESFKKRLKTYRDEPIINFLTKNNILPKYGFPVDTVNLEINNKELKGLDLSRDLSMAISEYAPGCEVVANNKLVTSRYIKKVIKRDWRKYDYFECKLCKNLNVFINTNYKESNNLCKCSQCGDSFPKSQIKTFLIPEFGFVSEEKIKQPSLIKPERTFKTEASFFSYGNHELDEKEYLIGTTKINIASIGNDGEMIILNKTDFYVCQECGYAIEKPKKLLGFPLSLNNEKHKNEFGKVCSCSTLERYSLGYKFKTDVIKIKINKSLLSDEKQDEAYSILQALILASCKELNIDNNEIAGCLQYNKTDENYSYILYDVTPGGAGHVKRLNNDYTIQNVLKNALNSTKNCPNCDEDSSCYSCLRTYQNQKNHDILKRKYVFKYLDQILND